MRRKLCCPLCGGEIEERGNVRFYGQGAAWLAVDGNREWVGTFWTTPVELLDLDDLPYYCRWCDEPFVMADLVPMPGKPWLAPDGEVHLVTQDRMRCACGLPVAGDVSLSWDLEVGCSGCRDALPGLLPARRPSGRPGSRVGASRGVRGPENAS